ncbi:chaplin [Kitasatospora sp. NPDC089913]|uniref:chaplin n=1 Tax=Kitasatospora sp. NPDC089913 TaxID=3364080 RepID=UPI003815A772
MTCARINKTADQKRSWAPSEARPLSGQCAGGEGELSYDYNTGHLNVAEDHHAAENLSDPHAASGKANRAGATHGALVLSGRGILSGNQVQVPVHIPLNVCGSSLNFVGTLNPVTGVSCLAG